MPIETAIIGTGATAQQLWRLVGGHPELRLCTVVGGSKAGKLLGEIDPGARCSAKLPIETMDQALQKIAQSPLVFSTLPNEEAAKQLGELKVPGTLIDLSGAHRLQSRQDYSTWYGFEHPHPENLGGKWQYGLPELFREKIAASKRIANPGCFATAAILAVAPFLSKSYVDTSKPIIMKGVSGISGAGIKQDDALLAVNVSGQTKSYRLTDHQHTPEIEQILERYSGHKVTVSFSPSTSESVRGIEITAWLPVVADLSKTDLVAIAHELYKDERFIEVTSKPQGTASVNGSNMVTISLAYDARVGHLIVTSAIDNLIKGAAGQALQNANIILKLPEAMGLSRDSFGFA